MREFPFKVQIEKGGTISIYCLDVRGIAREIKEEFQNYTHKHLTGSELEEFMENVTAEYYQAGLKAGREELRKELREVRKSIESLFETEGIDGKGRIQGKGLAILGKKP